MADVAARRRTLAGEYVLARDPHLNFFSFGSVPDREERRAYNRWHQLDHLPENRALPGVIWGDRWALTADCREVAAGPWQELDFMAMYWFAEPADTAVDAWTQLGEDSFQWGRGPLIPGVRRELLAFFKPVKSYASQQAIVAPKVLPMRPHTGVHVTVTEFAEPHSADVHTRHTHEDQTVIPALLDIDGVLGGWTFSYSHAQRHASLPFDESAERGTGAMRIRLLFLEGDPLAATQAIQRVDAAHPAPAVGELLLSSPLRTIIPWQDW